VSLRLLLWICELRRANQQVSCSSSMLASSPLFTPLFPSCSAYLANKALREISEEAAISKAETILRKETEWMRRQPKVRLQAQPSPHRNTPNPKHFEKQVEFASRICKPSGSVDRGLGYLRRVAQVGPSSPYFFFISYASKEPFLGKFFLQAMVICERIGDWSFMQPVDS
jgi:hypothetical protein